jgi:hypothetical protein
MSNQERELFIGAMTVETPLLLAKNTIYTFTLAMTNGGDIKVAIFVIDYVMIFVDQLGIWLNI